MPIFEPCGMKEWGDFQLTFHRTNKGQGSRIRPVGPVSLCCLAHTAEPMAYHLFQLVTSPLASSGSYWRVRACLPYSLWSRSRHVSFLTHNGAVKHFPLFLVQPDRAHNSRVVFQLVKDCCETSERFSSMSEVQLNWSFPIKLLRRAEL